jgi:enoyl-CoA hydratase
MTYIKLEKADGLALLTIDRPEGLNALNKEVLRELTQVLLDLADDDQVRALIITGAGDRAFVAGADIAEMVDMDRSEAEMFARFGNRVMNQISSFPVPVIVAVNGYALGGGFELALACDLRLASQKASFAFPETGLGITPGFGGTQRLARLAGPMTAMDLIMTGRRIKADEARALGIVMEVTDQEQLLDRARELGRTIASKAPVAVREAKRAITQGLDLTLAEGLTLEEVCFGRCFETKDQKRAMTSFLNKEPIEEFEGE